jgi:hypothetical protein
MNNKKRKNTIIVRIICLIILLIIYVASPLEIKRHRNTFILCLNRRYFLTDRYNYLHIIGNYRIKSKFGNIYLKTGDRVIDQKKYLGKFFNTKNHTLKIFNNDLNNIEFIEIYFYDRFTIKLIQELDIYNKTFNVDYIFYQDEILTFRIFDFHDQLILNDGTIIKLIFEEGRLYSNSLRIINNQIHLGIENFNVNNHYFLIKQNEEIKKSKNIIIDINWDSIIRY